MKRRITLALAVCTILVLAACDKDNNLSDAGTRTPLLPGGINVTAIATRAGQTDAEFFEEGDELMLVIYDKNDGMAITYTSYIYNEESGKWTFDPDADVLYYEDRDPDKEGYRLIFGTLPVDDQTTPEGMHQADYIMGEATLDPATRTLTAATMNRKCTKLTINITQGTGWVDAGDFATYIASGIKVHTSDEDITPMTTATGSYTCIVHPYYLPANGETLFTLTTSSRRQIPCTYTLPAGVTAPYELMGKTLTIAATLHATGHITTGTTTVTGWTEEETPGDLDGIKGDPHTAAFLAWADRCRASTGTYIRENYTLTGDIYLDGMSWEPIGDADNNVYYYGTLDGAGYTIYGLNVNKTGSYAGLFGYVYSGSVIRNLTLHQPQVKTTGYYAGGIAGNNQGTIIACTVTGGNIESGGAAAGGITGTNNGTITACIAAPGSIKAGDIHIGGITGINGSLSTVTTSYRWTGITYTYPEHDNPNTYGTPYATLTQTEVDELNTALDAIGHPYRYQLVPGEALPQLTKQ